VEYIKEVVVHEGKDETLPLLLQTLVKLETIKLNYLYWAGLSENFKQSVFFVLELPTLSTLEIQDCHFNGMDEVGSVLCHAKYLTHLFFELVSWGEKARQVSKPPLPKQTPLATLQLDSFGDFIDWLLGPSSTFTVSHITTLDITGPPDGKAINPLLSAIGGSLELCRFNAGSRGYGSKQMVDIDFDLNPNIRYLHLRMISADHNGPWSWVLHFFSNMRNADRLEVIELDVSIPNGRLDMASWRDIDPILAGPGFPFLQELVINLLVGFLEDPWYRMHDHVVHSLPLLERRRILVNVRRWGSNRSRS
jgi:hypothetical protein